MPTATKRKPRAKKATYVHRIDRDPAYLHSRCLSEFVEHGHRPQPLCACGARLLIGRSGLVCEACPARILPFGSYYGERDEWCKKFPRLVIVHRAKRNQWPS